VEITFALIFTWAKRDSQIHIICITFLDIKNLSASQFHQPISYNSSYQGCMFDEEEIARKLCNMSPHNVDILSLDYFLDVPWIKLL
jgi:hypothetical protein